MNQRPPLKDSDYRKRGFTQLHIKRETKYRLNIGKAQLAARMGKAVTHDDFIRHLLDRHTQAAAPADPVRELA